MCMTLSTLLLLLQVTGPLPEAPSCPNGEITHVFIDNHSIFDPASMPEDGRIRWAYRLANTLHLRTRADFIEDQILFQEGDCFDQEVVDESARLLREYRFIAGADAFAVEQPDGSVHVIVDTNDEWTTKLAILARFDQGLELDGAQLIEENFLGRGIALGAFYLERDERRDLGLGLEVPQIGKSRWDGHLGLGATRIGEVVEQAFIRPFSGERPGTAFRQRIFHRRDLFNYVLPDNEQYSHLVVPLQEEHIQLAAARRIPWSDGLVTIGGGLSYERVGGGSADQVEGITRGDFANREGVGVELSDPLLPHLANRHALRIGILAGTRSLRFAQRHGLDPVRGVQDIPLGHEVLLTVGPSIGSTGAGASSDIFSDLEVFAGVGTGSTLGFIGVSAEARWETRGAWRDVLLDGWGLAYHEMASLGDPVVVFRAATHAGWSTSSPFQLVLGGPDGVRGYSDWDHSGGRRIVFSGESRWSLSTPYPDFADFGVTLFGDVGQMWAGDAPFGRDSGWRSTVGGGLRVGFPAGSSSVIRFDLAWPLEGQDRTPVLRISAREWIGLLDDNRNPQLLRSRRSGLTTDFTGVARERRPPG